MSLIALEQQSIAVFRFAVLLVMSAKKVSCEHTVAWVVFADVRDCKFDRTDKLKGDCCYF